MAVCSVRALVANQGAEHGAVGLLDRPHPHVARTVARGQPSTATSPTFRLSLVQPRPLDSVGVSAFHASTTPSLFFTSSEMMAWIESGIR